MARWLLSALWQSVVCFFVPILAMLPGAVSADGHISDLWGTGTLGYTIIVTTVRQCSCTRTHGIQLALYGMQNGIFCPCALSFMTD
jgi:Phospholipid-translocating P-type ATPase C-terminal